jgi:hypothetical protein
MGHVEPLSRKIARFEQFFGFALLPPAAFSWLRIDHRHRHRALALGQMAIPAKTVPTAGARSGVRRTDLSLPKVQILPKVQNYLLLLAPGGGVQTLPIKTGRSTHGSGLHRRIASRSLPDHQR